MKAKVLPDAPIYGGSAKVLGLTHPVKDKDEFTIGDNIKVK
jgi:hydroxyacylglutathione hydrolase